MDDRFTWLPLTVIAVRAGLRACNHRERAPQHDIFSLNCLQLEERWGYWLNSLQVPLCLPRLHGGSWQEFLPVWGVSATQRDDEDTIQDALGRTFKSRDKRGRERGHGRGTQCLLCSGCELCEELPVCFFFHGWLVETRNPRRGSQPCYTKNIRETRVNKAAVWRTSLNRVRLMTLLFVLVFWAHGLILCF